MVRRPSKPPGSTQKKLPLQWLAVVWAHFDRWHSQVLFERVSVLYQRFLNQEMSQAGTYLLSLQLSRFALILRLPPWRSARIGWLCQTEMHPTKPVELSGPFDTSSPSSSSHASEPLEAVIRGPLPGQRYPKHLTKHGAFTRQGTGPDMCHAFCPWT